MAGSLKVVDASALAALLFAEPEAERVASDLGDASMAAPGLIRYEIGSVCLKKLKRHQRHARSILEALSLFDELELQELRVPIPEVVAVARRSKLTAYDASYLWLARELRTELVTLDAKLARVAARSRPAPR